MSSRRRAEVPANDGDTGTHAHCGARSAMLLSRDGRDRANKGTALTPATAGVAWPERSRAPHRARVIVAAWQGSAPLSCRSSSNSTRTGCGVRMPSFVPVSALTARATPKKRRSTTSARRSWASSRSSGLLGSCPSPCRPDANAAVGFGHQSRPGLGSPRVQGGPSQRQPPHHAPPGRAGHHRAGARQPRHSRTLRGILNDVGMTISQLAP
jgi:hypothetical protein